jgi:transposase-like protein
MRRVNGTLQDGAQLPSAGFPWGESEWFRDLEGTEARCREYLETLRWPDGVRCPRCESDDTSRIVSRQRFYCRGCRYHFSVTSLTMLHSSHLPMWKWFLTISLMIESEEGLPANQLVPLLGVTYKTAWFVEHRVRAAVHHAHRVAASPERIRRTGKRQRVYDRSLVGAFHQLDLKYLSAYLAEAEWRSQSRRNPDAFRDTVLRLLGGEPLAYSRLVAGGPPAVADGDAPTRNDGSRNGGSRNLEPSPS